MGPNVGRTREHNKPPKLYGPPRFDGHICRVLSWGNGRNNSINIAGAVPTHRNIIVFNTAISWNYDTLFNIAFLLFIAGLSVRFFRTGGVAMLRAIKIPPEQ
jgi:hypothetical protein